VTKSVAGWDYNDHVPEARRIALARTVRKLRRRGLTETARVISFHLLVAVLLGWLDREQREVIAFLREENRVLRAQLHGRRLRLSDDERCRSLEARYSDIAPVSCRISHRSPHS